MSARSLWLHRAFLAVCAAAFAAFFAYPVLAQNFLQTYDDRGNPTEVFRFGEAQWQGINTTTKILINALPANAKAVQIVCSVACHIAQASTPASATATSWLLPANTVQRLRVGGTQDSISILANGSNGNAYIVVLN